MKKKLGEATIIFISVVKWSVIAAIAGILVGVVVTFFLKIISWSLHLTTRFPHYYIFLPVAFFISSILTKYISPEAEGHGTEKVIEAVHKYSGKIKANVIPVKLFTTVLTIAFGGSVGKEGPSGQIGGGVTSLISDLLKLDDTDRRKLVICGISAGFASVFGTPIAGAIFGVEVLFVGGILYEVLLPSIISSIMAYYVSYTLGVTHICFNIEFASSFNIILVIKIIIGGILFGLVSFLLIELMELAKYISSKIKIWSPLKGFIGGSVLIVLTIVFSSRYLGLGLDTINDALTGKDIVWYAFIIKMIFTAITLNFGGSGGVITPIFFIGASSGAIFANLLQVDNVKLAAIGFVSVLAGATNTPIASCILAIELFGIEIASYAALSTIVSFYITGHRSIYPSQILKIRKSESVYVKDGEEVSKVKMEIKPRRKSLTNFILKIGNRIGNRIYKCSK